MIRLQPFDSRFYELLISWIDSEELMMQFAGPSLRYPLTVEQLDLSNQDPNRFAFAVTETESGDTIGHGELYLTGSTAKFGRIIIGNKKARGKGIGQQIVNELIAYSLHHFNHLSIELNVFDWNEEAIRCYEKLGFKVNPGKILERKIKDQTWIALNMVLDWEAWNAYRLKK